MSTVIPVVIVFAGSSLVLKLLVGFSTFISISIASVASISILCLMLRVDNFENINKRSLKNVQKMFQLVRKASSGKSEQSAGGKSNVAEQHRPGHYRSIEKPQLLEKAIEESKSAGYSVGNVDLTILAQRPKMAPHIQSIKNSLSQVLEVAPSQIGIKATTNEKLGPIGREEGIATFAVCLLVREET